MKTQWCVWPGRGARQGARTELGQVRDRMEAIYRGLWRTLQKSSVGLLGELRDIFGLED